MQPTTPYARFDHFNFNVADLEKSIAFYADALGLTPCGEIVHPDGDFKIVYLGDGQTDFRLELTWLRDHPQRYDLGECEFHLCVRVENYDASPATMTPPASATARWAAYASRTRRWGSTSSKTPTATG